MSKLQGRTKKQIKNRYKKKLASIHKPRNNSEPHRHCDICLLLHSVNQICCDYYGKEEVPPMGAFVQRLQADHLLLLPDIGTTLSQVKRVRLQNMFD